MTGLDRLRAATGGLRQRGSARAIWRRKVAEDGAAFQGWQRLPHHPGNKEKCQEGKDDTKCRQSQTVKADSVAVGICVSISIAFTLSTVSRGRADRVRVCEVRERMCRLENRNGQQGQRQNQK